MQGAKNLYRRLIHQRLVDNEVVIDDLLSNTGQVGIGMMKKVSTGVMSYASSGIMNAARRASSQDSALGNYEQVRMLLIGLSILLFSSLSNLW